MTLDPQTAYSLLQLVKKLYAYQQSGVAADSLPKFVSNTNIISTAFISGVVFDEDITIDLLEVMHQIYGGYVLAALGLGDMVQGTTVRNRLGRVSTEGFIDGKALGDLTISGTPDNLVPGIESSASGAYISSGTSERYAAGKVIEVKFGAGKDSVVTAYLNISIVPTPIEADTAGDFISLNFSEPLRRKFQRVRAGEISFFKDFIFAVDEVRRMQEALKRDKSGALANMLIKQKSSIMKAWLNLIGVRPTNNTASTILILDKVTFDSSTKEIGLDFSNYRTRQKWFERSMQMFVAVVDTQYAHVDLYINGIQPVGTYPFSAMKKASKNDLNVKDVIGLLTNNTLPRF